MSYVIILLAILLGSAIIGATFAFVIRARRKEVAKPVANIASAAAPVRVEEEVHAIGEQIEQAMADQRLQGETQRQLLAQKLDDVRNSVETQKNHVQGLRSEFAHESRRRDHEIASIRDQIGTIQQSVGLPSMTQPALSPAAAPTPAFAPSSAAPAPPSAIAKEPRQPEDDLTFPLPAPSAPSAPEPPAPTDEASFEDIVFSASPTPPPSAPEAPASFEDATFEDATFSEEMFDAPPSTPQGPVEVEPEAPETFQDTAFAAAPPSDDIFAEATFEDATFAEVPNPADAPPPVEEVTFAEPTFDAEPPAAPAGLEADPFATAPLYDEPIGGDSASSDDLFETWQPEPPVIQNPSASTPPSPTSAAHIAVEAPSASAAQEMAWISRPQADDAPVLTTASPSEFIDLPQTSAEPTPAPSEDLVDLDAMMAADLQAAPELQTPPPVQASPVEPQPPVTTTAPTPQPSPEAVLPTEVAQPTPEAEPPVFEAPEGAEDLTVITSIDEDVQRLLYLAGVLTLEEIAQWGRGQARRISGKVDVSEDTIMNSWVFEAQAALYNRYSQS